MSVLPDILQEMAVFWGRVGAVLMSVLLSVAWLYAVFYVVSLPMRRNERACFFLDLLETSLKAGQNVECSLVSASHSRDRSLGVRFHLLAAHLETGLRLDQALAKVPRLLPSEVVAMLKVGREIGDVGKVLPACRQLLRDGVSQSRGALNYLLVLAFVITPVVPALFTMLSVFVVPKLQLIGSELMDTLPPITQFVFTSNWLFVSVQIAIVVVFLAVTLGFVGGPRLRGWGQCWLRPHADRLNLWLPWRRKRLQRDFSAMLALLLDAGVPEANAMTLAAHATGNGCFIQRAQEAGRGLAEGASLSEAVQQIDDTGEFRWRLANAGRGGQGFMSALRGWLEALDAKAFQQEQAAAQLLTTGLVLVNGVMVGLFTLALFAILVGIIEVGAALW